MPGKKMSDEEFSALWVTASAASELVGRTPFATVERVQAKATYIRRKGVYLPYLPNEPGGPRRGQEKPRAPRPAKVPKLAPSAAADGAPDLSPQTVAAIYAAGVFDSDGQLEAATRTDGSLVLRVRVTSTKLCVLQELKRAFGGEISQLNGAAQLRWPEGDQTHAFLTAIAPYSQCEKNIMQAAQQYLENLVYLQAASDELRKVFSL